MLCWTSFAWTPKETSADVQQQWKKNKISFRVPEGITNLNSLTIGTLDVTTEGNPFFGIKAGRKVTLYIVNVDSSVGIGGWNYYDFPRLVQDIVTVLLDPRNQDLGSTGQVLSWFLP